MVTVVQHAQGAEPFRWKLFLFVMVVMASITAAAIILTLMANPRRGSLHAPPPQPSTQVELHQADLNA
jgi:hypothetical protein